MNVYHARKPPGFSVGDALPPLTAPRMTQFSTSAFLPLRFCAAAWVGFDAVVPELAALPGARATPVAAASP